MRLLDGVNIDRDIVEIEITAMPGKPVGRGIESGQRDLENFVIYIARLRRVDTEIAELVWRDALADSI